MSALGHSLHKFMPTRPLCLLSGHCKTSNQILPNNGYFANGAMGQRLFDYLVSKCQRDKSPQSASLLFCRCVENTIDLDDVVVE
jgi:hypothetical protein